ncbi:uncharacterized protein H6S33_009025 [Morchella sextelata]|uniref:uncharacterized protein n=1 Tax=Morchella sextelata TaxID=1174677 RepID=UPI001D03E2CE|nr:uncharacterized protein H6S33_009025 [Morchella sextelata]KAH0612645.1 hypothetical protein H6S33_009025 [Morchella sextelata]
MGGIEVLSHGCVTQELSLKESHINTPRQNISTPESPNRTLRSSRLSATRQSTLIQTSVRELGTTGATEACSYRAYLRRIRGSPAYWFLYDQMHIFAGFPYDPPTYNPVNPVSILEVASDGSTKLFNYEILDDLKMHLKNPFLHNGYASMPNQGRRVVLPSWRGVDYRYIFNSRKEMRHLIGPWVSIDTTPCSDFNAIRAFENSSYLITHILRLTLVMWRHLLVRIEHSFLGAMEGRITSDEVHDLTGGSLSSRRKLEDSHLAFIFVPLSCVAFFLGMNGISLENNFTAETKRVFWVFWVLSIPLVLITVFLAVPYRLLSSLKRAIYLLQRLAGIGWIYEKEEIEKYYPEGGGS